MRGAAIYLTGEPVRGAGTLAVLWQIGFYVLQFAVNDITAECNNGYARHVFSGTFQFKHKFLLYPPQELVVLIPERCYLWGYRSRAVRPDIAAPDTAGMVSPSGNRAIGSTPWTVFLPKRLLSMRILAPMGYGLPPIEPAYRQ